MTRTKCECFKIVKDHWPCSFRKNNMFSSFALKQILFTERTSPLSLAITLASDAITFWNLYLLTHLKTVQSQFFEIFSSFIQIYVTPAELNFLMLSKWVPKEYPCAFPVTASTTRRSLLWYLDLSSFFCQEAAKSRFRRLFIFLGWLRWTIHPNK